jgi:hypothetical protein
METMADALDALRRAWPAFAAECRSVLGSELHYQALLYHCLRAHGHVPAPQLGMNVKIWISDVFTAHFRQLDEKKHPEYRGGFEPIPDVVVFQPEINGDFRRRNRENTLRRMFMAVEVKASERHRGRLGVGELVKDIDKLEALRIEALHKEGSDLLPTIVAIDTAPEANERMSPEARHEAEAAARERGSVSFTSLRRRNR